MSIYFYASDAKEIKALCGVKALILPYDTVKKIKSKLDEIGDEKLSPQVLQQEFEKCLKEEIVSLELEEEYNHFKCLVHSRAANFFHIGNFMLRQTYSSYTRKRIMNTYLKPHSVFQDVLRYFLDYVHFHYAAYPIIEAHHLLFSKDGEDKIEAILYQDRIREARTFLAESSHPGDKDFSHRIGALIDRNFCLLLNLERDCFKKIQYAQKINKEYLEKCNTSFLFFLIFKRLIKRPGLWLNIIRVLLPKLGIVIPHILGRLFSKNIKKQNTGVLPAILSNEITIDPVGFPYKKQYIKGQEKPFSSPHHKGMSDLLWHILSRCAVIAGFLSLDVPENQIIIYLKKLRKFNESWRFQVKDAYIYLSQLDNEIIDRLMEHDSRFHPHTLREQFGLLETTAIDIFQKYRDEREFPLLELGAAGRSALNCAYMHL